MHLQHVFVVFQNADDFFLCLNRGAVAGVARINSDGGQGYAGFFVNGQRYFVGKLVDFAGAKGVVNFNVNRALQAVGAVVVKEQVIGSVNAGNFANRFFYRYRRFAGNARAQNVVKRVLEHFNRALYDKGRKQKSDVGFQRNARKFHDKNAGQH